MAYEAKAAFMNDVERRLTTTLTAADMAAVMKIISDQLSGYNLESAAADAPDKDDLLDVYLSAMAVEGRSAKTIERYRYLITRMMAAVGTRTRNITVYHLRKYLSDEKTRGISDRTLEGTRQVFSSYFNWLQRERLIDTNPTAILGHDKLDTTMQYVILDKTDIKNAYRKYA